MWGYVGDQTAGAGHRAGSLNEFIDEVSIKLFHYRWSLSSSSDYANTTSIQSNSWQQELTHRNKSGIIRVSISTSAIKWCRFVVLSRTDLPIIHTTTKAKGKNIYIFLLKSANNMATATFSVVNKGFHAAIATNIPCAAPYLSLHTAWWILPVSEWLDSCIYSPTHTSIKLYIYNSANRKIKILLRCI